MESQNDPHAPEVIVAPYTAYDALTAAVIPFASARTRSQWTLPLLAIAALLSFFGLIVDFWQIDLMQRAKQGDLQQTALELSDSLVLVLAVSYVLTFVVCGIAFAMWFHRVYRNLPALGAPPMLTTAGWAAGCWFIPVLNLFQPFQAAREIAVYSNPMYHGSQRASEIGAPDLVKVWWAVWLISNFIGQASTRLNIQAEGADTFITARTVSIVSEVATVAAAILAIAVVRRLTADQDERQQLLASAAA